MNWNGTSSLNDLLSDELVDRIAQRIFEKLTGTQQQAPEKLSIDSRELAALASVSLKFVEKHRNRIVGAVKIGGTWRYDLQVIRTRVAAGKSIILSTGGR